MLFCDHQKLVQLPMGQFYHLWAWNVEQCIDVFTHWINAPSKERDILLYLSFQERREGRRRYVTDMFCDQPYCFNRNRPRMGTSWQDNWAELKRSKYVLSPLGLEVDCTRTWECFSLGAIPIVEHSFLDPLYSNLPILLVDKWDEINEEYLNSKYDEILSKPKQLEKTTIQYWAKMIKKKQIEVRKGDTPSAYIDANNFSDQDLVCIEEILNKYGKLHFPLIYKGNMTCLRPFQVARHLPLPHIELFDNWTHWGIGYISWYAKDRSLINRDKVQVHPPRLVEEYLKIPGKSVFIDLTHFRHKLFHDSGDLSDFIHSLEPDLLKYYNNLCSQELMFGNKSHDPYVKRMLENLNKKHGIPIIIEGDYWVIHRV